MDVCPNAGCVPLLAVVLAGAAPKGEAPPKAKDDAPVGAGAAAAGVIVELLPNANEGLGACDPDVVLAPLPNNIGLFAVGAAEKGLPALGPLAKPPNPDFGAAARGDDDALVEPNAVEAPPGTLNLNFGAEVASAVSTGLGAAGALPKPKLEACGFGASGAGAGLAEGAFETPKLNLGGAGLEACEFPDPNAGVVGAAEEPNADVGCVDPNTEGGFAELPFAVLEEPNTDVLLGASGLPLSAENGEPMGVVAAGAPKGLGAPIGLLMVDALAPNGLELFAGGALKLPNPLTLLGVDTCEPPKSVGLAPPKVEDAPAAGCATWEDAGGAAGLLAGLPNEKEGADVAALVGGFMPNAAAGATG